MTNYREILRLSSLGLNKTQIAQSAGCSRTTVIQVLNIAELTGLDRKVVDKTMAAMKKDGSIVSPVRCKWEPAE